MICKCNNEHTPLMLYVMKYRVCFGTIYLNNEKKRAPWNVVQKIVHELNCFGTHRKETELKRKAIRTRNSAQLLKSESAAACINDINVINFFRLQQALSFPLGVYIFRPSEWTGVKRRTNVYFSIKGHVRYVHVCVCLCVSKILYICPCRVYIPDKCFKIIFCCMIRR